MDKKNKKTMNVTEIIKEILKKHMTITETDRNLPIYLFTLQHITQFQIFYYYHMWLCLLPTILVFTAVTMLHVLLFLPVLLWSRKKKLKMHGKANMAVNY